MDKILQGVYTIPESVYYSHTPRCNICRLFIGCCCCLFRLFVVYKILFAFKQFQDSAWQSDLMKTAMWKMTDKISIIIQAVMYI